MEYHGAEILFQTCNVQSLEVVAAPTLLVSNRSAHFLQHRIPFPGGGVRFARQRGFIRRRP